MTENNGGAKRQSLKRAVTFRDYVSLGLGAMFGMGWVVYTGEWLTKGGPLGAMAGFVVGGLVLVPVGLIYAELTPAIPVAGGGVAFSYKAFGPLVAFMSAWLLAFGYIMICPFETVALGWILEHIAPSLVSDTLYEVGGKSISISNVLPGVVAGGLVMFLNIMGVRASARFQMFSTVAMLVCVVAFAVIAVAKGNLAHMLPLFPEGSTFSSSTLLALLSVVVLVPFWMSGFDTIPQTAEESGKDMNPRRLGTAVIVSIFMGICFYVLVIFSVSIAWPWRMSVGLDMPTSEVFIESFGYTWAARLVLVAALLGLVTSLNGFFVASTRVLFSAGRGGLLPAWFAAVDPKRGTPVNAIVFVGFFALAGPFIGKALLWPIVHAGSFAFITVWLITCLAAIRLRKTAPDMHRPYKVRHEATLYFGAVVAAALALCFVIPGSPEILAWPEEAAIVVGWVVLGLVFYLVRRSMFDISKEERDRQILGEYR